MIKSSNETAATKGRAVDFGNLDIRPEMREMAKVRKIFEELLALAKAEGHKRSDAEVAAVSGGAS